MSLNFADVVVLGNDLSGLIAGSLLAKRGLGVLVLEENPATQPSISILPPRPLRGLGSPFFRSFLGVLGIPENKFHWSPTEEPIFQVVMPKARIDLFPDRSLLTDELTRTWPNDRIGLTEFLEGAQAARVKLERAKIWDLFPLNNPKDEKAARMIWSEIPELGQLENAFKRLSAPAKTFFHAILKTLAPIDCSLPTLSQAIFFFSEEGLNAQRVQIRDGLLRKWLAEKLEYFGGEVRPYRTLEELKFARKLSTGLKISGFQAETKFRYVLANTDIASVTPFIPRNFWFNGFRNRLKKYVPSHCTCSAVYQIPAELLPLGLAPTILCIDDIEKPLLGLNYLQLMPVIDPAEHGGMAQIIVTYRLSVGDLSQGLGYFDKLHEIIRLKLEALFPFSDGQVELMFPREVSGEGTGELFDEEPRTFQSFKTLARHDLIYASDPREGQGLHSLGNMTPYHNLFLTGPQVLGHLGTEGKILCGLRAADLIWEQEKIHREG